ncbi:MAG: hypothetical protein Q4B14_07110, partial [Clostridia bacterium]|nr:hypothetical protein [Clostridia bacterium]
KVSRNNTLIALVSVEDLRSSAEIILSNNQMIRFAEHLKERNVVRMRLKVSLQENQLPRFFCEDISNDLNIAKKEAKANHCSVEKCKKLYIRLPGEDSAEKEKVIRLIDIYSGGDLPVYIYYEDSKKTIKTSNNMCVFKRESLIEELSRQIGKNNVKIVK